MNEEKIKLAVGQIRKRRAQCLELAESTRNTEDYLLYSGKADVLNFALIQLREAMN